jgi:hypothetical protein
MRLTLRIQKLAYIAATLACLMATVAVVAWGLHMPELPSSASRSVMGDTSTQAEPATDLIKEPSREDFAQLLGRPLRRMLYDPPPPQPEVKQLPALQVELLGTIVEPENSMAMVRNAEGGVEYKRVGDAIGPSDSPGNLIEIHGDSIIVERDSQRITFRVRGTELR